MNLEAPKYAVLIDGKWGAGKTHFIKNYFEQREGYEFLYISLNGVSSVKGIEDQFFEQLHPFLSSKTSRITGKILKGLLKASLKIDIDGDGSSDGSASIQLPDIKLSEELNQAGERVLVFDDLERAKLSMKEVLGYINQFVEQDGQRVIVIGNEDSLDNKDSFERIKEKVFGRTFYVQPYYEEAFPSFLRELKSSSLKKVFSNNQKALETIFLESEHQNLRLVRYGIIEFQRFYTGIESLYFKSIDKKLFIKDIIIIYFMFTLETGSGSLKKEDFKRVKAIMSGRANQSNIANVNINLITQKYDGINFSKLIFSYEFWERFFSVGTLDKGEFEEVERNPKYFLEVKPIWYQLWDIYELSDNELKNALSRLEVKKKKSDFTSVEEIIHIVGTLIELHSLKIYPKDEIEIITEFLVFLKEFVEKNKSKFLSKKLEIEDSMMGCQVRSYSKSNFKDFIEKVELIVNEGLLQANQEKVLELFDLLDKNFEDYKTEVIKYEIARVLDLPFFSIWDLERMMDILKRMSPKERRELIFSIKDRITELKITTEDKIWVENLNSKINQEFKFKGKSIENFSMIESVKFLEKALLKLNQ